MKCHTQNKVCRTVLQETPGLQTLASWRHLPAKGFRGWPWTWKEQNWDIGDMEFWGGMEMLSVKWMHSVRYLGSKFMHTKYIHCRGGYQ